MRAPGRHRVPKRPRKFTVDGRRYAVSVSDAPIDPDGNVPLHVAFRAQFGSRSVCLVRGLTNRSFWHDYPNVEQMREQAISITPLVISALIRLAHQSGWNPAASKSNFELQADRELIRKIADKD